MMTIQKLRFVWNAAGIFTKIGTQPMKTYYARLGNGLYLYKIKARSLKEARKIAKRMCIYKTQKVIMVF